MKIILIVLITTIVVIAGMVWLNSASYNGKKEGKPNSMSS